MVGNGDDHPGELLTAVYEFSRSWYPYIISFVIAFISGIRYVDSLIFNSLS